jgi:tetratricopeptide (TPR) repeat protein
MKIVHKNPGAGNKAGNWLARAKELEQQGELEQAAAAFEKAIKQNPLNEYAYDRLMIIYRQNKEYKKEKSVIVAGLKAFQQLYKSTTKLPASKKIISLSNALLKATGLSDKKGKPLYEKEPLGRWNKRLQVVLKKMQV